MGEKFLRGLRSLKHRKLFAALTILLVLCLCAFAGVLYYARTSAFMAAAGEKAGTIAEETLGLPVDIGQVSVDSLHQASVTDVDLYDKDGARLVHADKAVITFGLLGLLKEGVDAIDTVKVSGVEADLSQREDGTWNVEDISTGSSSSTSFHGKVELSDATVHVKANALPKTVDIMDAGGTVDFANSPLMAIEGSATVEDTPVEVRAMYRKERQTFDVKVGDIDIEKFLPYIPEGMLPDGIAIEGGTVKDAHAQGSYYGSVLTFAGDAALSGGKADVLGTVIEDVEATAHFTQSDALVTGDAVAAGQKAHASGMIHYGDGVPLLDITASSDAFDPSAILTSIPYQGAASFTAHITGEVKTPTIEARASVASGEAYGVPFQNAKAKVRYDERLLYVKNAYAEVFGGKVTGEAAVSPQDLMYSGHLKVEQVEPQRAASFVPTLSDLSGRVSADIDFDGTGTDPSGLDVYGSVIQKGGAYKALPIEQISASFSYRKGDLIVDYASAHLPNGTSLGIEGSIHDLLGSPVLSLSAYGGHVDLSLVQTLVPQADMTGLADFSLTAEGPIASPVVELGFVAQNGTAFKQPFDNLRFRAGGSLDGVHIDDFSLVKDGVQRWYVDGTIGLAGEKKLDIRADTVGVRAEDLAALIAPDQPITGNVDNTIRLTGTLDDPRGVGYIHFYRGSYNGMLLQGMDGDYFLDEKGLRLQDFHIFSPRIDVDVNGYVLRSYALDLSVDVHEIDFARLLLHPPYPIAGKGTFAGKVGGTVDAPTFSGTLASPGVLLNGVYLRDIDGLVEYQGDTIYLRNFSFFESGRLKAGVEEGTDSTAAELSGDADTMEQEDIEKRAAQSVVAENDKDALDISDPHKDADEKGKKGKGKEGGDSQTEADAADASSSPTDLETRLQKILDEGSDDSNLQEKKIVVTGSYNRTTEAIAGTVNINQADLRAVSAILNHETDVVGGTATIAVELGGTLRQPTFIANGNIDDGTIAGYEIHNAVFSSHMEKGVIYIDTVTAQQGEDGVLSGFGTVTLGGPIDAELTAHGVPLSMFTKAAGIDVEVTGTVETHMTFSGTTDDPSADATLVVTDGGAYGASFDTMQGSFHYAGGSVKVDKLKVEKTIGDKSFEATADGTIPIRALTAGEDEMLESKDQMSLTLSLDKANLALLPVLSKQVDWVLGDMKGYLAFTGTAAEPRVNGNVSVTGGAMKFKLLEVPVTNMDVDVQFLGNSMTVRNFSGNMGDGTYTLTGRVTIDGHSLDTMDFKLDAKALDIKSDFFKGPLDLTASITEGEMYGRRMPKLTGTLDLHDCTISVPTIPDSSGDMPEAALDLTLAIGDRVRAYSPALCDLTFQGGAHFGGTTIHPISTGTISTKRGGTIRYLKNIFNVREGSITFDQVDSFLPSIDFFADTKLTRTRIFLSLKGPIGSTEIRLQSEPEMSQTEIMRLLLVRSDDRTGSSFDTESLLLTGLQMTFLAQLEDDIASSLWLDKFTIAMGSGSLFDSKAEKADASRSDRDVYHLEMGKYISDKLMVKYYQGLGSNTTSRVGLTYNINERYGLTYEHEGGDQLFGIEANIQF